MADTTNTPGTPLNPQGKGTQLTRFYEYLYQNTATCTVASAAIGAPQKSLCHVKRRLEKANLLAEVREGRCPITGRMAAFLTTDPAKFSKPPTQLNLFA